MYDFFSSEVSFFCIDLFCREKGTLFIIFLHLEGGGLSSGAIAGIVIGTVIAIVLVVGLVFSVPQLRRMILPFLERRSP
jgi:hypothetical protein